MFANYFFTDLWFFYRYGEANAKDFIPGAEVVEKELTEKENNALKRKRQNSDSEPSDSDWEHVYDSSDDEIEEETEEEAKTSLEERQAKATEITSTRILTDEDFKKIEAAQLRKQVQGFSKSKNKRRKLDKYKPLIKSKAREELVDLANIEMIHKKRRHDKEARLESVMEGRKDREKFGSRKGKMNEFASKTHKEKNKKKNFMMMKHKLKFKSKRSFVEKQAQMKKAMLRSKKFK